MSRFVVFKNGSPQIVSGAWRSRAQYRQHRKAIDSARDFADVLAHLEQAMRQPDGRVNVGLDFSPSVPYARRFLATAGLFRTHAVGTRERALADRATKVVLHILCGGASRPTGRPLGRALDADVVRRVKATESAWSAILRQLWHAAGADRRRLAMAISLAGHERMTWASSHLHELARLLSRRGVRPVSIAIQLTAWELGLSVHHVRRARAIVSVEHA